MLKIAAIQMSMSEDIANNIVKAEQMVRRAASFGAKIILLPELFSTLYFCKDRDDSYFTLAQERQDSTLIKQFSSLAKELSVVLPISYFEKCESRYFNSVVIIDADGRVLGNYRKTHIPDGAGYEEKYYFSAGDSGFMVFETLYAKIGVGICWDQWFPESSRSMALLGAEILMFPTAIGSEPEIGYDSQGHWHRVQQGAAAANIVPLMAANRVGEEVAKSCSIRFYGSSFICDESGKIIEYARRDEEDIICADLDLSKIAKLREYWGLFRDRRKEVYL